MQRKKRGADRLDKPVVGDIIHCRFLDHAQGSDEPMHFEIFGLVEKVTRTILQVYFWRYVSDVDRAKDDNRHENEDSYAIVRKTITYLKILK
jgi:hypothetical protein